MSSDKVLIFPTRRRSTPFDRAFELQLRTLLSAMHLQVDAGAAFAHALGMTLLVCSASFKVYADLILTEIDEAGSKPIMRVER